MEDLLEDAILLLCHYLTDQEKIYFLSTSSKFDKLKMKTSFNTMIENNKILDLVYFDRFTNVTICRDYKRLPALVTHLTLYQGIYYNEYEKYIPNSVTHIIIATDMPGLECVYNEVMKSDLPWNRKIPYIDFDTGNKITQNDFSLEDEYHKIYPNMIPKTVKRLHFCYNFDKSLRGCIPNSVTHLSFLDYFNRPIKDCIPDSVTNLKFGWEFNQPIDGCIPNSVIKLKFGDEFKQPIEGCIPNSVIHLSLGYAFNQRPLKNLLPPSVTHLHVAINFMDDIDTLPDTLKYLSIDGQPVDIDGLRKERNM
uniref:F-box domain-containing protein n=1 Tax=viral metagenome TaxID=1070528 RepID=A0A6C0C7L0_9ZZZZ